jgi:hypothetical protein
MATRRQLRWGRVVLGGLFIELTMLAIIVPFPMIALELILPLSMRNVTLTAVAIGGLVTIVVHDWRTANRWDRERAA